MIDELKTKIDELKKKEREIDVMYQTISILQPLYTISKEKLSERVAQNSLDVIKDTVAKATNIIKEGLKFDELIAKLDAQIEIIENKSDKEVIVELKTVILKLQDLSEKTVLSTESITEAFDQSIHNIVNILTKQNELPNTTEYKRVGDKISQVIEKYNRYTLTHKWSYNKEGALIKVTTVKDETT